MADVSTPSAIPGLRYVPDWLDEAGECALLAAIDAAPWSSQLKRRVQHYGWRYDYTSRSVDPGSRLGPLPPWAAAAAAELRRRGMMPRVADQLIVNEYQPGQGIAAHVDCVPCFADTIASLTLGSSCVMEFSRPAPPRGDRAGEPAAAPARVPLFLARRSLIVLSGAARYDWRHAIPGRLSDEHEGQVVPRGRRVSLTFRNVVTADERV